MEKQSKVLVTELGKQKIILGFPWQNENYPDIDWKTGKFTWQTQHLALEQLLLKGKPAPHLRAKALAQLAMETESPKPTITDESDKEEELNGTKNPMLNNEILLAYFEEV